MKDPVKKVSYLQFRRLLLDFSIENLVLFHGWTVAILSDGLHVRKVAFK